MHDRLWSPVRLGGGGFRPAVERAQFSIIPRNVAPQFLETLYTWGLWPSLDSAFGTGSFNDENEAVRWAAFYASGIRHALALKSEWGRSGKHAATPPPVLVSSKAPRPFSTPMQAPLDT